jgi:hypothetical protein
MATVKVPDFINSSTISDADLMIMWRSSAMNNITFEDFKNQLLLDLLNGGTSGIAANPEYIQIDSSGRLAIDKDTLLPNIITSFQFSSDLDNVRYGYFNGHINVNDIVATDGISSYAIETRIESVATWTTSADVTALNSWLDSNVSGDELTGTEWILRLSVTFGVGETNAQALNLVYRR